MKTLRKNPEYGVTPVRGVRGLARACGVSSTTAWQMLHHEAWAFGDGPWDRETILRIVHWRRTTLRPASRIDVRSIRERRGRLLTRLRRLALDAVDRASKPSERAERKRHLRAAWLLELSK